MNSYLPRPAKPLAPPKGAPVGQPYNSDALDRLTRGNPKDVSLDALGRATYRGDQNRSNFHAVSPTAPTPETPIGGLKPSPATQGALLGGTPKYKNPFVKHGSH